jgi:hypothetical protein
VTLDSNSLARSNSEGVLFSFAAREA